jgi:succinate dehydrogenase hydrophobic anchor subunit
MTDKIGSKRLVVGAHYGLRDWMAQRLTAAPWFRTIGVFVAVLSAGVHFMFMPYQPVWSAIVIALDVAIIWALTAHGRDIAQSREL